MALSGGGSRTQLEPGDPPSEGTDDYALMASIAARDPEALSALYDRHSSTLLAICVRVLRDRAPMECRQRAEREEREERRPHPVKDTTMPGCTSFDSSSASQFVSRTQPCEPVLSILVGSGVPWMP